MKWNFANELARYGPDGQHPPPSRGDAWAYCARVARCHYENFSVASLLLPRRLQRPFHAVYAYCRWADDLADEDLPVGRISNPSRATPDGLEIRPTGAAAARLRLLQWWRDELAACYDGSPRHPVMSALGETIRRYHIPQQPFLDLITAFEQDQRVTRYATFEQLRGYCHNSANPVGRLVLYLCECHDEKRGALSDHVCTALQLANFWQDVVRDLDIGRVYLPAEDRLRFGYGEDDLHARRFTPAFAELMRFEVERTRELFFKGYPLVELMPADVQSEVELFIEGGLAILNKIEQRGYDVLSKRPALAKWEKGVLVLGAMWRRVREQRWVG